MPLLRRQPFVKDPPPPGLKDEDEVFVCQLTGEMFLDYEKFFERVILCNSLVWTCELTGKSGLTYQEALDSEKKAAKTVASLPDSLQKPILYLSTLTHRSRLNDLNEDIYSYVKDRYFIGETVEVLQKNEKRTCKVIKVISPASARAANGKADSVVSVSDDDSDVVCLDDPPKAEKKESAVADSELPKPEDYEYVCQQLKKNNLYVVKADCISRAKGRYTREKSRMYLKANCAASASGIWKVKDKLLKNFKISEVKFSTFFDGPEPTFTISEAKRKPSGMKTGSFIDLTDEDQAIRQAKKVMKEKKKLIKETKKLEKLNRKDLKKKEKMAMKKKQKQQETSAAEPNFDELRKMSAEERQALKEKEKAEKLAARLILKEELKKKMKEESQKRKEERDKEREKRKEEKKLQEEYLKEWSKPRDDMECDDLKDLPVPVPVRSRIPMDLFGDSLMVLEYLHSFDELLDLDNLLPNGLSLNELGKALQETDANGPYYDLLRMFLLLLFQLQEEEDDEDEGDEDEGNDTGAPELFEDQSFKELVRAATKAAQLPQMNYGTPLRKLPLNNFTMTEILRLHFLSSGAKGSDENIRFRYQQRGAYTPHDDAGLEFKRQEVGILKSLGEKNVFDLNPGEKLKILTALIHQVLTFVATRDIIEDNFDKLKSAQGELRNHRFKEHRREKDEATFWYKKRLEERAREKELEQQKKEGKKKAKLDKLAEEENGIKPSADAQDGEQSAPKDESMEKDSPQQPEAERHSTRQKEKMESKFDDDFFESAVENIQWEKITPEDRIRMKEKHTKKECELMELVDEAQHGTVICPVGRDRTFRRYWMFRSVPGLFVEDHDEFVMDDLLQPVPQIKSEKEGNKGTQDEKSTSDKENDSFDQGKDADTRPPTPIQVDESLVNGKTKPVLADTDNIKKDPDVVEVLEDKTSETKMSIHEQISQRNQVVWAYYTPEQIDTLIESLNPRGFREGSLKAALVEQKSFLMDRVKETPTDVLDVNKNSPHKKSIKYQSIKSRNKVTQGAVNNASAEEFLELNLREALLDIEERIYVGSLGTLKVKDRLKWRDAIENGAYKALCEELTWCGNSLDMTQPPKVVVKPKAVVNGDDPNGSLEEIDDDPSPAIQDLTKALLQIEQSLEEKYLGVPIGIIEDKKQKQKTKGKNTKVKGKDKEDDGDSSDDDESVDKDKDTQKTARERWEISLMASTSFSQLFLHLGTLESSVTWSKSTLHARCHICRRKGDGEKMLLCDGCDRGHHMYCLKPQVKNVPRGDWFCPDCRPKDVPKTPRKRRKSVFEEEEEETEESVSSEDDDSSDDDDDSSSDSDDDDSDEETEEETEEETTPQPAKIKFVKGNKKQAAQPSKAPAGRSRKSLETSQPSSRASSQERDRASSKSRGKAAEATSKPVKRKLEVEQKTKSKGNSRKSLDETVLKKGRRSPPQPENTKGSRRSLDSVKIPAKRKRDEEEEEMPDRKKGLTKSRGGDKEQAMKICEDLLVEVTGKKESWPFMMPVSKRDAPDYFDIIKRPMDFSTIKNKVNRFEYLTPAELLEDIRVTLRNCEQYNMPTAPEYQAGQKLSRFLEKRVKECNLVSLINKKSPKKGDSPKSPAKRQTRTR